VAVGVAKENTVGKDDSGSAALTKAPQGMGKKEYIFIALFNSERPLGIAERTGKRRIFKDIVELYLVPLVLTTADGIALDDGRLVESV